MNKNPTDFRSPASQRGNYPPKPHLYILGQGVTEELGLYDFVRRVLSDVGSRWQVVSRFYKLPGGHNIAPSLIAKDLLKTYKFLTTDKKEKVAVLAIIDHENRPESWSEFIKACRDCPQLAQYRKRALIAVASRSIEAWFLADTEACRGAVIPSKAIPRQEKYKLVESVPHPVEKIIKQYWPNYDKVKHGPRFLAAIRSNVLRCHSASFMDFLNELSILDQKKPKTKKKKSQDSRTQRRR